MPLNAEVGVGPGNIVLDGDSMSMLIPIVDLSSA